MRLGALVSGGKDGLYALWRAQKQGHEVACLVCVHSANPESYMFHTPNTHMVGLQARALGIPLVSAETKGEKERELEDLERALAEAKERFGIGGVVCGALASRYQKARVEGIAAGLGLAVVAPLWGMDPEEEMRMLLDAGFGFVVAAVAAQGLGEEWLGRRIGRRELGTLGRLAEKHGFNVAGEGGEYETLVLDAPNFSGRIEIVAAERRMQNEFTGMLGVREAKLVGKAKPLKSTDTVLKKP